MSSNTTARRRRPRHGRGSAHHRPRRSSFASHARAAEAGRSAAAALEPTLCNVAPVAFTSLDLDARLVEGTRDLGFKETRPIQSAVIPMALAGHDVIACAETGTGKTCAFVVPILQGLLAGRLLPTQTDVPSGTAKAGEAGKAGGAGKARGAGTAGEAGGEKTRSRVLILAPTRELAVQIEDEIHGLSYHTTITSAAVYGGVEMGGQERALKAGVDIIVATPGRLMDHMRQQNADLTAIEVLVLDEADRMMDMGFWPDVRRIVAALPAARQTLLFSATIPDDVVRQALEIVRDPKFVQVGHRSKPAQTITHQAAIVPPSERVDWLVAHLRRPEGPVLVFTRTKIGADKLARQLASAGIKCIALHADRTMEQRRAAVEGFRGGRYHVLVATDIAARGLDIDGIHTVINYELPDSPDTYVHRVGRTGRANEAGHAITLVAPDERHELALLEKIVGVRIE